MGTRSTQHGIRKAFLANKVRGTPVILSKRKLKIHILVTKDVVFDSRYMVQQSFLIVKLRYMFSLENYCI